MEIFRCPNCDEVLFFDNLTCTCGTDVVFDADAGRFRSLASTTPCANRAAIGCNWQAFDRFCGSCATTRTRPDLSVGRNRSLWADAEMAKRRVLYDLMHWGLFTVNDLGPRPIFDLLAEETRAGDAQITMGHANGVITINVDEADAAAREARRMILGERYRTMVGHFRHEIGHFVFLRLKRIDGFLPAFRNLFGDERTNYQSALDDHYAGETPEGWQKNHLTRYAAAHPHEDWAETHAHYLHLVAVTASSDAISLSSPGLHAAGAGFDAYAARDPEPFLSIATELSIALNHVTRAMGLPEPYPFVLNPRTRDKLAFVQAWLPRAVDR